MLFLGPALGPTVGGALIGAGGWRAIFLINVLIRLTLLATVVSGFAVLGVASLGLLVVAAATPLWLIALILACRSASVGLIINPLLQALTQPLRPVQSATPTLVEHLAADAGSVRYRAGRRPVRHAGGTEGPVAALHAGRRRPESRSP